MPITGTATQKPQLRRRTGDIGQEHHEPRQILGFAAQAIVHPRPHARPISHPGARQRDALAGAVNRNPVIHRSNDAQVIDHAPRMRKQTGNGNSAITILPKRKRRSKQFGVDTSTRDIGDHRGNRIGNSLPIQFGQRRFRIERVRLPGASRHEQKDEALGSRWVTGNGHRGPLTVAAGFGDEHRGQRDRTKAHNAFLQEVPAVDFHLRLTLGQ